MFPSLLVSLTNENAFLWFDPDAHDTTQSNRPGRNSTVQVLMKARTKKIIIKTGELEEETTSHAGLLNNGTVCYMQLHRCQGNVRSKKYFIHILTHNIGSLFYFRPNMAFFGQFVSIIRYCQGYQHNSKRASFSDFKLHSCKIRGRYVSQCLSGNFHTKPNHILKLQ